MKFFPCPEEHDWVADTVFRGWSIKFRIDDCVPLSNHYPLAKATLAKLDQEWSRAEQTIVDSLLPQYNSTCAEHDRPTLTERDFVSKLVLKTVKTVFGDDTFDLHFAHAGLFDEKRVEVCWFSNGSFSEAALSDEDDPEDGVATEQHAISRVVPSEDSPCGHFFGGGLLHENARYENALAPFQLLYCFNTKDPQFPLDLDLAGMSRIALYYPFFFNCPSVFYQAFDDGTMFVFEGGNEIDEYDPDFPYPGFPLEFPRLPVTFQTLTAEEVYLVRAVDANLHFCHVEEDERVILDKLDHPFFTRVGTSHLLLQPECMTRCLNPDCPDYDGQGGPSLVTFATVWNNPVPGISLWGEHGKYSQIVYDICPACGLISASNRAC